LRAIIEGNRWASDLGNRQPATAMVAKALKLDEDIAAKSIETAIGARPGLARDACFDMEVFRNTLRPSAEMISGDAPASPEKYLDLSYYSRALGGM
jgi:hypothetical protein